MLGSMTVRRYAEDERARRFYGRTGWRLVGSAGTHDVGGTQVGIVRYELAL